MDEIQIDRVILELSGLSEAEGTHLAALVARGLAAASFPAGSSAQSTFRLELEAAPSGNLDIVSEHIVREIVRQLAQSA